jgi:PTS system mannose-specific IIA component
VIGIVVVTHGRLAEELVNAARTIAGDIPKIVAVSIGWADDMPAAREAIVQALAAVGGEQGALVLTDMFGGTPTNVSLSLLAPGIEIVTGVNLPMLVRLSTHRTGDLKEVARLVREKGRESIVVAGELLGGGA